MNINEIALRIIDSESRFRIGLPAMLAQDFAHTLYANLKDQFEDRAYWSCEAHEPESGWAWAQDFRHGGQLTYRDGYELRARAVRRIVVKGEGL